MTWDDAGDRAVILDAEGSTMFTLNPVGTLLWSRLDAPRTADELVAHLRETFPQIGEAELRDDVSTFLTDLVDEGLLVAVDAAE